MKKEFWHSFLLVVAYGLFLYILTFFLFQRDMVKVLPSNDTLNTWDAGWYKGVADHGYSFSATEASNVAFFILFPAIWKLTHLSALGISFLNLLFFATGFAIFTRIYKLTTVEKLVMISFPAFYFFLIPYSEALFTLLISLLLFGIAQKKRSIIWVALILVATTRPTAIILLPAFLITEIIAHERRNILRAFWDFLVTYGIPLFIGLGFMLWYQHYTTGVWFAWSKAEKFWGKELSMPVLPFNSENGPKLLWLNALAMLVGLVSFIMLIKYAWKWLVNNIPQVDRMTVVSFLYMTAIFFEKILFSTKWGTGTTNVYDALRYVFANPFFWVFVYHFTKGREYKGRDYLIAFLLSNSFWLTFASYKHIQYFIYFNFCTAIVLLYMAYSNKENTWAPLIILAINLLIEINMFQFFLQGVFHG